MICVKIKNYITIQIFNQKYKQSPMKSNQDQQYSFDVSLPQFMKSAIHQNQQIQGKQNKTVTMAIFKRKQSIQQQKQFLLKVDHKQNKSQKQMYLKRNRQSAKLSRQRKKQFIQTLQKKYLDSQQKIQYLTTRLRTVQLQYNNLKHSNQLKIESFIEMNASLLQKLKPMLQNCGVQQIQNYLLDFKEKFGPAGKDRTQFLNYCMRSYIENILDDFQTYFLSCSINKSGFFGQSQRKIDFEIRQMLQINEDKKKCIIKKYQSQFCRSATLFSQTCQNLYQNFIQLSAQAKAIQTTFMNSMSADLEINKFGKLLIWFQQNKHRCDVRSLKEDWFKSLRSNQDNFIISSVKKRTKFNQFSLMRESM